MRTSTFSTTVLGLIASFGLPVSANWIQYYGGLVIERADPVVDPGKVSAHVHNIVGGSGFSNDMTFADTQNSECTSMGYPQDLSNYWIPMLYVKLRNGSFTQVPQAYSDSKIYYQQRPYNSSDTLHAYPEGFRMVAGDTFRRSFSGSNLDTAATAISYACEGGADNADGMVNGTWFGFPKTDCSTLMRAQVYFPSCSNGELDSADHKSHMSYYKDGTTAPDAGECPDSHPIHMISLFMEFGFSIHNFIDEWTPGTDDPPWVWANGDTTGYGLHGDYVMGWKSDADKTGNGKTSFENAVATCLDSTGFVDCPAFYGGLQDDSTKEGCKIAPTVEEQVDGFLAALPGCNPLTYGPAEVVPGACSQATPAIGAVESFTDMTSQGWSYQGCATDSYTTRTLAGTSENVATLTVEGCMTYCASKGYSYAGAEYGTECYCDNSVPAANAPVAGIIGNCNMACGGSSGEICGGPSALSLYKKCASTSDCSNVVANSASTSSSTTSSTTSSNDTTADSSSSSSSVPSSSATTLASSTLSSATASSASATVTPKNDSPSENPIATGTSSSIVAAAQATSTSSSSTSGTAPTLPSGWSSLGCYTDSVNPRALPVTGWWGNATTSSGCVAGCEAEGYAFAGTENAGQCFCGNDLVQSVKTTGCDLPCTGEGGEICGAAGKLSLFGKKSVSRVKRHRHRGRAHGVGVVS